MPPVGQAIVKNADPHLAALLQTQIAKRRNREDSPVGAQVWTGAAVPPWQSTAGGVFYSTSQTPSASTSYTASLIK